MKERIRARRSWSSNASFRSGVFALGSVFLALRYYSFHQTLLEMNDQNSRRMQILEELALPMAEVVGRLEMHHYSDDIAQQEKDGEMPSSDVALLMEKLRVKRLDKKNAMRGVDPQCPPNLLENYTAPGFIIAGAQKAGTTALANILEYHPRLLRSDRTEPHFFDVRGRLDPDPDTLFGPQICLKRLQYSRYFNETTLAGSEEKLVAFEKTPAYLVIPEVPSLIKRVVPWAKIVVILRDPVERAWSQHKMNRIIMDSDNMFEAVLNHETKGLKEKGLSNAPLLAEYMADPEGQGYDFDLPETNQTLGRTRKQQKRGIAGKLLSRGLYSEQLKVWLDLYQLNETIKVVRYESFLANRSAILDEICDFVNVPRYPFTPEMMEEDHHPVEENESLEVMVMSNITRQYLQRFYAPYNRKLGEMLGPDWVNAWGY